MNWDDLRVFLAVARGGRVSVAARQLGVEHSTVSRRIAALEGAVGAPLFYRTRGGYRLTRAGATTLAGVEAMERNVLALGGRLREETGVLAGPVRLAILDELASHWLAPRLGDFHARHPDIELRVVTGIEPLDLSRGEAELAVRTPRPRQTGLSAVRIARTAMGLYASRAWLDGRRLKVDARSRALELLVYGAPFQRLQSASWFAPVLASSRVVMSTNSSHALIAAARAGVGVAVVPHFMARAYDELVAISEDVSPPDEMWLVTHPDFRRDPRVRAVVEFLRKEATRLC